MSGQIIGPIGVLPSAVVGPLTFTASTSTPAWQVAGSSVFSFTADVGSTSGTGRMIVAVIGVDGSAAQGNVTGVTVGGVSMTQGPHFDPSVTSGGGLYIYYVSENTLSGSQTVAVTTSGAFPQGIDVQVGMITGSSTVAFGSSGVNIWTAASSDPQSVTSSSGVPANGVAVTGIIVDRTFTVTPTGFTNDKLVSEITGNIFMMAMGHGTANNPSFTGANGFTVGMVIATFGP